MLNYKEFVSCPKSMLVAPAGYGKTFSIAESIKYTEGRQLILTHTHAGVASIKEKLNEAKLASSLYNVETISSFSQKFVLSFVDPESIPNQENSKEYFPFIIKKAVELFKIAPVKRIIQQSYMGLFVDEYQDCTLEQHELVLALSKILSARILGDPLQAIFNFKGNSMVDLRSKEIMGDFLENSYELKEPWRWKKKNPTLGSELNILRTVLLNKESVNLQNFRSFNLHFYPERDMLAQGSLYNSTLWKILSEESLLLIHPESKSVEPRILITKFFRNSFSLIESIDDKLFYELSRQIDLISPDTIQDILLKVCWSLFNKTGISNWFNDSGLKKKKKPTEKKLSEEIQKDIIYLQSHYSHSFFASVLKRISRLPSIICYRKEVFTSLLSAMEGADVKQTSVHSAMIEKRNVIRRVGRKIYGRCIGTTLLTKGLEFDTVVVLNAHRFQCPKNFYVALTRACKRLIIFSEKKIISPYPKE